MKVAGAGFTYLIAINGMGCISKLVTGSFNTCAVTTTSLMALRLFNETSNEPVLVAFASICSKPTAEITKVAFGGAEMEKLPFASAATALLVPLS